MYTDAESNSFLRLVDAGVASSPLLTVSLLVWYVIVDSLVDGTFARLAALRGGGFQCVIDVVVWRVLSRSAPVITDDMTTTSLHCDTTDAISSSILFVPVVVVTDDVSKMAAEMRWRRVKAAAFEWRRRESTVAGETTRWQFTATYDGQDVTRTSRCCVAVARQS